MKEIAITQLAKTITSKRLINAVRVGCSYLISRTSRRNLLWGYPFVLTVEPSNQCNLNCPQCYVGAGKLTRTSGYLDWSVYQRLIDEVGDYLLYLLLYNQGEPYLYPDLFRFIKYAKAKKIYVTTSTNGHFLDEPTTIQKTIDSGLDTLIISLDGADEATYRRYRRGGDFHKVVAGVKNLQQRKKELQSKTPLVFLQFLIMKHNEAQVPAIKHLAEELRVEKLLLKTLQVETRQEADLFLPQKGRYRRYRIEGDRLVLKNSSHGSCQRLWTSSVILCNGEVVPCCFDKNGTYRMGKISPLTTFYDIWRSENYDRFRKQNLLQRDPIDICRNCTQGLEIYL